MFSFIWGLAAFVIGRSATMSDEAIMARIDPYTLTETTVARGKWWRSGWIRKDEVELLKPQGLVARYYRFILGIKRFPVRHGALNFACGAGCLLVHVTSVLLFVYFRLFFSSSVLQCRRTLRL